MNSTVFAVAVVSAVVGAVVGVLLHCIVSSKSFNELAKDYLEAARKADERAAVIKDLQNEINKLHQALAVKAIKAVVCTAKKSDFPEGFFDVNDLPKHFNDDIDFGG